MRVLICGGREFDDWKMFHQELSRLIGHTVPVVIAGGAKGADFLARVYAKYYGFEYEEYPAQWNEFGFRAGSIRNQQMLDEGKPDLVIAFPGGKGTADMVSRAEKAGFKTIKVGYE